MIEYQIGVMEAKLLAARGFIRGLRKTDPGNLDLPAIEADYHATLVFLQRLDPTGKYAEPREFTAEQVVGLTAVGFTYITEVKFLALEDLLKGSATKTHFNPHIGELGDAKWSVPSARQVAINPETPIIPDTERLGISEQLKAIDEYVNKLRARRLKKGTLDGVSFGLDRASAVAQIAIEFNNDMGRQLLPGLSTPTIDRYIDTDMREKIVHVGHAFKAQEISVIGYPSDYTGGPYIGSFVVATPEGER